LTPKMLEILRQTLLFLYSEIKVMFINTPFKMAVEIRLPYLCFFWSRPLSA
jgi:hypothetical protein